MGALLRDAFGAVDGLRGDVRPGGDGSGDHLWWRTAAWDRTAAGRVLLVGHHDTVFPPGTFEGWRVDGDLARGPGVLDMKGGIAVVYTALAALADAGALASLPVAFVSVADEEVGSPDSRPLLEEIARGAACALVFEAGRAGDAIITRRKGTGGLTVEVHGRAAHAGNHHADGINAIWALARFVDAAQRQTDYDRGVTVNVGVIAGGTSRNTVPARAECGVDLRFVRAEDGRDVVDRLRAIAGEIAADTGARFDVRGGVRRPPLERTPESVALYERYARAARASGLGDAECDLIGGGSDANTISALGVPCIDGLGPRGAGFHTHDEYIELSSLPLRTEALLRFLLDG
ncbi:MAG: M20 family peptidase [Deltaproteobacteria bacterium]|nr:MAG: M20 family peptidase [Deltaproteobacteria bacterium]